VLAVQFVPLEGKAKSNAHHSFLQCHYRYCLKLKKNSIFTSHVETVIRINFSNLYYKITDGIFSMNCSKGAWLRFVTRVPKGEGRK